MVQSNLRLRRESERDTLSTPKECADSQTMLGSSIKLTDKSPLCDKDTDIPFPSEQHHDEYSFRRFDENGCITAEPQLPRRYKNIMLMFACLGNFVVIISRLYPSGFYLDFLVTNNLNTTLGTMSISIMLLTSALSPLFHYCLPKSIKISSLHSRCLILCLINTLCIALMSLVDVALKQDPSGISVCVTIFVLRAVQGIAVGLLYVLVQGEVVDLYFKDDKMPIILISAFLQIGAMLSTILSAELFVHGGWVRVGLVVACFNFLPLMLLPFARKVHEKGKRNPGKGVERELLAMNSMDSYTVSDSSFQKLTSNSRRISFFIPDMMVFLNNLVCDLFAYVLPARLVFYCNIPLTTAVPLFQTLNLASLFTALGFSFLASKNQKFDVLGYMTAANFLFYFGTIVAFASTTSFLQFLVFPYQLLIGLVLSGIGVAGHLNLVIMSKFTLYEKWNMRKCGLAKRSTMINNVTLSLSATVGTAISGFTLSGESEVPTLVALTIVGVCLTVGLILCKLVK